jgi:hypothetical protein
METGLFIRNLESISDNIDLKKINFVVLGDYGCGKRTPSAKRIISFKPELDKKKIKIYYISPKTNQAFVYDEIQKLKELIDAEISVSINDYGVLYGLSKFIKPEHSVFIGRLLTKSIYNWEWGDLYLSKEDGEQKEYLSQHNFNQKEKIDLIKKWNIRGIEINAYSKSEKYLQLIKNYGIEIIGYADNRILSISRSCPLARENKINVSETDCIELCSHGSAKVYPDEKLRNVYPDMNLDGNVIFKRVAPDFKWDGYNAMIYYDNTNSN